MSAAPSLDGRVFVGVANDPGGDVGTETRIIVPDDGPLELHEEWEWESQPGTGTSLVREITAVDS